MAILVIAFILTIIISSLCSIWEAVLLSVTPSYVAVREDDTSRTGKLLKKLKDDIDRPLSAILTLNTAAHTVGATVVGVQGAKLWPTDAWSINFFGLSINLPVAAIIVPTVLTLAILILSEIIPKTLAASHWKKLTKFTAISVNFSMKVLYPFVWLSQLITGFLLRNRPEEGVFSRKDFRVMASIGEQEGIFRPEESEIIQNLLALNQVTAENIMTPRTVLLMAPADMTVREFYEENKPITFSRIPVYQETQDNVIGFALKHSLFNALLEGRDETKMEDFARDLTVIKEDTPIHEIFTKLIAQRQHIALVTDDYGGTEGLVTMEDVFETLLGEEIVDELDSVEDLQQLAKDRSNYPDLNDEDDDYEDDHLRYE